MFKSQLQEFAQKVGWPAPVYDITRQGPSHEPQFKAVVTIKDETYESPTFYANLKKAEHAAAEVALAALAVKSDDVKAALPGPLHESGLCKNLLQEYAQKCNLPIPIYSVVKSGATHSPLFCATVEIAGMKYKGGVCQNKKEAEIKAAKTALIAICSDLGGSPSQAFENKLSSVGQHADAPSAPSPTPSKPGMKRKKKHHVFKGGYKQWKRAESKGCGGNGNKEAALQSNNDNAEHASGTLINSTSIPGITLSSAAP